MCIVIDVNVMPSVFDKQNVYHEDFLPVLNWIYKGKGVVIYGGSKYLKEIPGKYLPILLQLNKARKAKYIPSAKVDSATQKVSQLISHKDFDDQHIVGLLKASGCKLICSLDARAYPYFRHNLFFTPARNKPKIYSSNRNAQLLSDANIADICKPCEVTTKNQKKLMPVI